ncbi:hypothetical protein Tco_0810108 [Tanacetum coccineum]
MAEHEAKRAKMLKEFNECINKRANQLPIIKIICRITFSQDATMRFTRGNDLLNVVAKKLGVPPLPQLLTFGISNKDKKRKRTFEIIQEVFVKEDVVVDGMHKKLAPPGVEGRRGLVIRKPKALMFYYNGKFDLVFQSDSEFHLATTIQLVRLQGSILRDAPEGEEMFKLMELEIKSRKDALVRLQGSILRDAPGGEEMFKLMELEIESRKDAVKAREIIKDNLDGIGQHQLRVKDSLSKGLRGTEGLTEYKALASNIRRIQVKDIVKEVEDYLKTYSSARMDISCQSSSLMAGSSMPSYDQQDYIDNLSLQLDSWEQWKDVNCYKNDVGWHVVVLVVYAAEIVIVVAILRWEMRMFSLGRKNMQQTRGASYNFLLLLAEPCNMPSKRTSYADSQASWSTESPRGEVMASS